MDKKLPQDEFLRKRAIRQKKLRKRRMKIIFCLFLILCIILGVILSLTVFFPIKKIVITGSKLYSVEEIFKASGIENGENLIMASEDKVEQKIKEKLPFVDKIEFDRDFPSTLNIKIYETKEYMVYHYKDAYYSVSESGWVMKKYSEKPEDICSVAGIDVTCKVGSKADIVKNDKSELLSVLQKNLSKTDMKINAINIENKVSIILEIEDGITVKFGTSNFLEEKIKHINKVVEDLEEGQKGEINISMYTKDKPECVFSKKENN